ncbi:MAG: protease pro-enzyme activation domain-containing protein, partial [Desulfosporosinus sp.]
MRRINKYLIYSILFLLLQNMFMPRVMFAAELTSSLGITPDFAQVQGSPVIIQDAVELLALSPSQKLNLFIYLRPKDSEGLQRYAREVYDFNSPHFRRHLKPELIWQNFSYSSLEIQPLLNYLIRGGLTLDSLNSNGTGLTISGDVEKIEKLMHTELALFQKGDATFYANKTPVRLPDKLQKLVTSISGLDNYPRKHLANQVIEQNSSSSKVALTDSGLLSLNQAATTVPVVGWNESFAVTNSVPTGQYLIANLSGLPRGSRLANIQ